MQLMSPHRIVAAAAILIASLKACNVGAFTVQRSSSNVKLSARRPTRRTTFALHSTTTTTITTSDETKVLLDQLGISEGKLALGLKPAEVLKYIGTREDLIVKTLSDIPAFDRIKAETEVDKFLMDFEMMNLYIQYGKEIEKDPDFVVPDSNDEEGIFSFRTVVILYLAYVAFTSIPDLVRRYIAEQQIDGTWQPTNIPFVDNWIDETSADAIARVLSKTVEAAAATADAVVDTAVDLGNAAASTTVPVSSAALLDSIAAASSSIFTDPTVAAVMDAVQAGVQ